MRNQIQIDGCVFTEGEFKGFSDSFLKSSVNTFFLTMPSFQGFTETVKAISRLYRLSDKEEYRFKVAKSIDDLITNVSNNRKSIILTFQEPYPIGDSLDNLRAFYELGVRVIQLTYNKSNYIGSGCTETEKRGLTDFGKGLVKEMNRLGILIDLSHCSEETSIDAIKESEKPVIFSHANVKSISHNPRNKSDSTIKLLAKKGGVIGLTPWAPTCWKGKKALQPTLDDYLDHVEYVIDLVGINHVGFGGDATPDETKNVSGKQEQADLYPEVVGEYYRQVGIDPKYGLAKGFQGSKDIANVIKGLSARGYNEDDIEKFLGGNFLRVLEDVWK